MTSKITLFYNPITSSYYRSHDLRQEKSRPSITNFSNSLCFDGGLNLGLLRKKIEQINDPFPPCTRI